METCSFKLSNELAKFPNRKFDLFIIAKTLNDLIKSIHLEIEK